MSSATQILFNSPALNSLKREQLIKLCKRHGLKANGKNAELVERLKLRATELPLESIDWREDDDFNDDEDLADDPLPPSPFQPHPARPSEQWEVVMDDIDEEDEPSSRNGTVTSIRSPRTMGTPGEFGTRNSKGSVTSSLKAALANSFGLKRAQLAKAEASDINGTTRSLPNLPTGNDLAEGLPGIEEPPVEPIPGAPSRPGKAAPSNARLSTGSTGGPTTTIRLISTTPKPSVDTPPRLKPFQTTFDLDMGTPSATKKNVWPASPAGGLTPGRLYPAIPPEDLRPSPLSPFKKLAGLTPAKGTPAKGTPVTGTPAKATPAMATPAKGTPARKEIPSDEPLDIFSPAKPVPSSNSRVRKTLDVPAKPQGRLSVSQHEPFLFGSPLPRHSMTNKQFDGAAQEVLAEMNRRLADAGVAKVEKTVLEGAKAGPATFTMPKPQEKAQPDRFAKAHEQEFSKMDSIVNHYAARRPPPAPLPAETAATKKRKSEALGPGSAPAAAAKRQSNLAQARVFSNGNRKKMGIPGGFGMENDDDEPEEDPADRRSSKRIKVNENEDIHKGRRVSLLSDDGKTAEERAAEEKRREKEKEVLKKKIEARRRSGHGQSSVGSRTPVQQINKAKPRLGFLSSAKSLVRNVWNMGGANEPPKPPTASSSIAKPLVMKPPVPHPRTASGSMKPTVASEQKAATEITKESSGRSRGRIPSFNRPAGLGLGAPPGSSMPLNIRKTSNPKPPVTGASSLGARATMGPPGVNSLGLRRPTNVAPAASLGKKSPSPTDTPGSLPVRKRTTSTLFAPTASSLAKRQNSIVGRSAAAAASSSLKPQSPATLQQITNSAKSPLPAPPARIFSQPLPSPASSPTPRLPTKENASLAATATKLMENDNGADADAAAVPPKPKSLIARKPRISRSKVVAKLGHQRNVSTSSRASTESRTRSSTGAVRNNRVVSGRSDVLMSAKKAARQSEYMRRKSCVGGGSATGLAPRLRASDAMQVDA